MIIAVSTISVAVLILGCATISTATKPISTEKGSKPTLTSRMRSPLLASQVLT